MSKHEVYLTDDAGARLLLLDNYFFLSYTKSLVGYGTVEIGLSYDVFISKIQPVFRPDRRLEVWRSPADDYPLRLERIYFLRKPKVYERKEDNVKVVVFYGRDTWDLLSRRYIIKPSGSEWAQKTDQIDDMMKAIVREQMLYGSAVDENGAAYSGRAYPAGEFAVQADNSLGPTVTRSFADKNVLEILKELQDTSFQLYTSNPLLYRKIYFDVVEKSISGSLLYILDEATGDPMLDENNNPFIDESSYFAHGEFGFEFQTFADIRGTDRTSKLTFSVDNGNLEAPWYSISHLDEVNSVYVKGQGRGESRAVRQRTDTSRSGASRWNIMESVEQATYEVDLTALDAVGDLALNENRPAEEFYATFLSVPGSDDTPRSLYGLDWELGDILSVEFAGIQLQCEVTIVYVSVDEKGSENILGRNRVD